MKIKLLLIGTAALLLIVFNFFFPFREYIADAVVWLQHQRQWGGLIFFCLFVACAVFFVPFSPLIMMAGTLYGYWKGYLLVAAAALTGVAVAYGLGKRLWRRRVEQLRVENPRFETILSALTTHGNQLVFLIRLNPFLPFTLLNYLFTI